MVCARRVSRSETRFQSARELSDALREVLGGDARELQWTSPEVASANELTPNSQARTRLDGSGSDPRAAARPPNRTRKSAFPPATICSHLIRARPRCSRATVRRHRAAVPLSLGSSPVSSRGPASSANSAPISRRAESEVIAQLLRSAESEPPRRRSGAGLVLSVAGIALAIGLGAGWVFMKRNDLPHLRPLPSAVPPAHESALPRAHSGKPPEHAPSAHEEPSASPSASAPAKPAATAHAAPEDHAAAASGAHQQANASALRLRRSNGRNTGCRMGQARVGDPR